MRSIEYLIQLFPDKTGKELLEIQAQDKKKDEEEYQNKNKENLAIIKDIKENGGFYKGAFGTEQYYMYHVVVMEEIEPFPVLSIKGYHSEKPHCRLFVLCDNEQRVFKGAKIIHKIDSTTKRQKIKIT